MRLAPYRFIYTLALLFALLWGSAAAQQLGVADPMDELPDPNRVVVTLTPSKTQDLEVGDLMNITAKIPTSGDFQEIELEFPEDQKNLVYMGKIEKRGTTEFDIKLRPLQSGEYTLGPVKVKALPVGSENFIEMTSDAFKVEVTPPAGSGTDPLKPHSSPLELPFSLFWQLIAALGGLGIFLIFVGIVFLALVYTLWKIFKKRKLLADKPLSPIEAALWEIGKLKELSVFRSQGAERHYTALSFVVRRYIERQLGYHATEMTEDEIVELVKYSMGGIPRADTLPDVMRRSSMAKFAKRQLTEDVAREDCLIVESFLNAEKERIRQMEQAAKSQNPPSQPGAPQPPAREDRAA